MSNKNTVINTANMNKASGSGGNNYPHGHQNNYNYMNSYPDPREMNFNTLDSCTSSEFRAGLGMYEESFISQGNNDIENLNIEIKPSNV